MVFPSGLGKLPGSPEQAASRAKRAVMQAATMVGLKARGMWWFICMMVWVSNLSRHHSGRQRGTHLFGPVSFFFFAEYDGLELDAGLVQRRQVGQIGGDIDQAFVDQVL